GGDERVDPRSFGFLDRLRGALDVLGGHPGEGGDSPTLDVLSDGPHRLEVAGRSDRKPGFDHIHVELRKVTGDFELLIHVEVDTGRLLTVSKRRVKDANVIHLYSSLSALFSASRAAEGRYGLPPATTRQ